MSIFNELLPEISEISKRFTKNFNDELKAAFECFNKFEEEFKNGKIRVRETQKDKSALTSLPSINEIEDEIIKSNNQTHSSDRSSTESTERKGSKKRSKHEVDGIESPEVDKRQKRNASVKAQNMISKQVNVNLTQKMRREASIEKSAKGRPKKDEDKENAEPPAIKIKEEKISLPAEPMDVESLSIKMEPVDNTAMPPPAAPVPKPRKGQKEKKPETSEEEGSRRRTTRTQIAASTRSTRASSRAIKQNEEEAPQPEVRPKRTRAKKVVEKTTTDSEKDEAPVESVTGSPAEKPRPKRTAKVQKAAKKEPEKEIEEAQEEIQEKSQKQVESTEPPLKLISPKNNCVSLVESEILMQSSVLQNLTKTNNKAKNNEVMTQVNDDEVSSENTKAVEVDVAMDKTKKVSVVNNNMDTTVILSNGIYNHVPVTPKNICQMNETVILDKCNETVVLDKPQTNVIMDATVVIEANTDQKVPNLTDDNSLLTEDSDSIEQTPPKKTPPVQQPTSAVKEKVQQFEEMASRGTRTKTRAMAKKEDPTETQTPPDKISKAILSSETLTKMNNMIFNGKTPQISNSATKPRVNTTKTMIPTACIPSGVRCREDEKMEKEDARRKKEALLEAKREMQKKKREDKMAAAAAARSAAERERLALLQAAARDRREKEAHADLGKLERLKEVERRKQELARKAAETEERRRAEEAARRQRLADERRRADERQRAPCDADAAKKEAAIMAREMQRRQKEFVEIQKMKQLMDGDKILTPLKTITGYPPMDPVHMCDGFEYLHSDEDEEPERIPTLFTSKTRLHQLYVQVHITTYHIDKLFSVREHTPDLQVIFPSIEKKRLKRTSSAVWRTPPRLPVLKE